MIYFSKLISDLLFFIFPFGLTFSFHVFPYSQTQYFYLFLCRITRSSSAEYLPNASVISRPDSAIRALAYRGYAAALPQAARPLHASLPAGTTPSTWVPPVQPGRAGRMQNVVVLTGWSLNFLRWTSPKETRSTRQTRLYTTPSRCSLACFGEWPPRPTPVSADSGEPMPNGRRQ